MWVCSVHVAVASFVDCELEFVHAAVVCVYVLVCMHVCKYVSMHRVYVSMHQKMFLI
jgi:hypothetical protein